MRQLIRIPGILIGLLYLCSCAVNPVTGKKELDLVSEAEEIAMGEEHYFSSRQQAGGDYVVDPQLQAYVNEVGQKIAAVSDKKLPYEFTILNDSTPNAWALPGGKIGINRGLLVELQNEAQLAAVLGHEVIHSAIGHTAQNMERGVVMKGALTIANIALGNNRHRKNTMLAAGIGVQMLNQKYGRDAEREADYYGMIYMSRAGYNPAEAIELQKIFVSLSGNRQADWLQGLFASHPPSMERVRNNEKTVLKLPEGGELGEERYARKLAYLKEKQAAYDLYDRAVLAVNNGEMDTAMQLLKNAMLLEPKEAQFYHLKGLLRYGQKQYAKALINYNRAIERNDSFYIYYRNRGYVYRQLQQLDKAEQDFAKSLKLLPTGEVYLEMGDMAYLRGSYSEAKNYYQRAASVGGKVGEKAKGKLAKMGGR